MRDYKEFFKDKRITIMGLGLLGRGLGYAKFFAECGADLLVTDLKTKGQLAGPIKELKKFENIKFVLGKHRLEDFRNRDMIIKNPGVPDNSIFIKEARKNKIPVEMDVSLFAKLAPEVMIVGITGTRGKSMTTALVYEILKSNEKLLKRKIYIGGNVRGVATLPLLKKVKAGDILVSELDSWQLAAFGEAGISPRIAVFTSFMPDHMNYYRNDMKKYFADKANIFKYQRKGDVLIIRPGVRKLIPKNIKRRLIVVRPATVRFSVPGEHQKENLACAIEVAKLFKIPMGRIEKAVKNFRGLEGRLEYVRTLRGVKIYNDNNATTPEATIAGLKALFPEDRLRGNSPKTVFGERKIVLICGGSDKKLDLNHLVKAINKYCKAVILIPGTGTDRLKIKGAIKVKTLEKSVRESVKIAKRGDTILFSPAFASFGMFNNEYERNDEFMKIIKGLK